jgi:glycerophosphoryl diester phosphodiesterase
MCLYLSMDIVLLVLLMLIYLFVFNAYARPFRMKQNQWLKTHLAHRGLYTKDQSIPENSLAAFIKAKDLGFGSELDVSLSKDGHLMVFHDDDLKRMCGIDLKVSELTKQEIQAFGLKNTQEIIPTLAEVLNAITGSVPLMIEVKPTQLKRETVLKLKECLKDYVGHVALVSFDPYLVLEFKKQMPEKIRGLIMEPSLDKEHLKFYERVVLHFAFSNAYTQADFISVLYSHPSFAIKLNRFLKAFIASWTINSPILEKSLQNRFQCIIFEDYIPYKD